MRYKINKEKFSKYELNRKDAYVTIMIDHYHYTFDMNVHVKEHDSIKNIINEFIKNNCPEGTEFDVSKLKREGYKGMGYKYDTTTREDNWDNWFMTKKEKKRFKTLNVNTLFIVPCEVLMWEKDFCTCFGETNKKYGVIDIAESPCKTDETRNIFSKISYAIANYKYNKRVNKSSAVEEDDE